MRRLPLVALVVLLIPALSLADTEISDWTGAKVTLAEGDVVNRGVRIHYHTVGEGPLVILLHSVGEYWFDWREQIPSLAKQYKVVAISMRGADRSDKPSSIEAYSAAAVATDIDAVIRQFGAQKAIIIGFSAGGFYGWYFAMHYPERVERLVTIGAFHPANLVREYATNPIQQKAGEYSRNFQEDPNAAAEIAKRQLDVNAPMRAGETSEIRRMRLEAAQRTSWDAMMSFYKANWPSAPYALDKPAFGGPGADYPKVTVPTLVLYGREDRPVVVDGLNDLWKWVDGELTMVVLAGRGHSVHREAPEFVTSRLLDWLASRRGPTFVYPPTSPIKTP